MQTSPEEMRLLSERFFGNKIIDLAVYQQFKQAQPDGIKQLLKTCYHNSYILYEGIGLIDIFVQYFSNQLRFVIERDFIFEKGTCLLELSVHLFDLAWEKRWNKDKTFEEFRQVIVRHSLYRPPHSVYVFTLNDLKEISQHFLSTFFRNYNAYYFTFTPWVDIVISTYQKHQVRKDVKDIELEKLRQEGEQYNESIDPQLNEELMQGNSIFQIPEKKKKELLKQQQQKEKQERIDRILKAKLDELQLEFDAKVKQQDEYFLKFAEDLRNPPKKK